MNLLTITSNITNINKIVKLQKASYITNITNEKNKLFNKGKKLIHKNEFYLRERAEQLYERLFFEFNLKIDLFKKTYSKTIKKIN